MSTPTPTHFLALRVSHSAAAVRCIEQVQKALLAHSPGLAACLVAPTTAHISVMALVLPNSDAVAGFGRFLTQQLQPALLQRASLAPLTVPLQGLSVAGQDPQDPQNARSLYLNVAQSAGRQSLIAFAEAVREVVIEEGLGPKELSTDFIPRVLIATAKKIRAYRSNKGAHIPRYIPQQAYSAHLACDAGVVTINELQLCSLQRGQEAFYPVRGTLTLISPAGDAACSSMQEGGEQQAKRHCQQSPPQELAAGQQQKQHGNGSALDAGFMQRDAQNMSDQFAAVAVGAKAAPTPAAQPNAAVAGMAAPDAAAAVATAGETGARGTAEAAPAAAPVAGDNADVLLIGGVPLPGQVDCDGSFNMDMFHVTYELGFGAYGSALHAHAKEGGMDSVCLKRTEIEEKQAMAGQQMVSTARELQFLRLLTGHADASTFCIGLLGAFSDGDAMCTVPGIGTWPCCTVLVLQLASCTLKQYGQFARRASRDTCRGYPVLPLKQVQEIARQLLSICRFMHSLGYVHRDIKPVNVLVMPGPSLQLRLADFGCVKQLEVPQSTLWGSANYLPPALFACRNDQGLLETALGQLGPEAHSLDLTAAAVTLVEAYSGSPSLLRGWAGDAAPVLPELVLGSKQLGPGEAGQHFCDLLTAMLGWGPHGKQVTAAMLLQHPFFSAF